VLDQQHGMYEMASTVAAIGPVRHAGASPVVRVPLNDFASASRALDVGAEAVIAPMINKRRAARRFVGAMKYPPGRRAQLGGRRAPPRSSGIFRTQGLISAAPTSMTLRLADDRDARGDGECRRPSPQRRYRRPVRRPVRSVDRAQQRGVLDPFSKEVETALDVILEAARSTRRSPASIPPMPRWRSQAAKRGFPLHRRSGGDSSYLRAARAAQLKGARLGRVQPRKSALPPI
jgi:4-hydroxy-2-oxoheptanedioate aldolase